MRLRLTLIALALAVLAFAGLRQDAAPAPHSGTNAPSQLSSGLAPDHEPPTIVRAAATASATAQIHAAHGSRAYERPVLDVSIDGRHPQRKPGYQASLPQSFPLLI